jgi:hypothetical protein
MTSRAFGGVFLRDLTVVGDANRDAPQISTAYFDLNRAKIVGCWQYW